MQGRQSGSLAWRLARQETKHEEASKNVIIKPTKDEELALKMELKFDIIKDCYTRSSEVVQGWSSLTHQVENVIKKEEFDWKMVYLARKGEKNIIFMVFILTNL